MNITEKELILAVIIYLTAYAIDPFIWLLAFKKFLKPKYKNKIYYILCFSGIYLMILVKQGLVLFTNSNLTVFFFPIMLVYILTVSKFLFGGKTRRRISVFIAIYLLSISTDCFFSIVFILYHISSEELMTFGLTSSLSTLIVRLTNLILYFSLKNFYEIIKEKSGKLYMLIIYIALFVGSYIILAIFFKDLNNHVSILYCIYSVQLTFVIILTSYAIVLLQDKTAKEKEAIKKAELSESKLALFKYAKETCEEMKSIKHDLKGHYNYILELNRLKDHQAIENYLLNLCSKLSCSEDLYLCDNLILAVAIHDKKQKAKELNIKFSTIITANTFPFTDTELNSVVTNLLDNAFEAVLKVTIREKIVKFTVKKINQQEILIYCANTYNKDAYMNIPFLSTIKIDRENHGYGTKIVKTIVTNYAGSVVYWKDNTYFYVKIIVRGNEEHENFNM